MTLISEVNATYIYLFFHTNVETVGGLEMENDMEEGEWAKKNYENH